jgi:simple sugar transport system ATP-binding protein
VHRRLLEACQAGAGLLLISEDLDEILSLADRIAVMTRGRLTDARPRDQWTLATLGLAMSDASHAAAATSAQVMLHDAP